MKGPSLQYDLRVLRIFRCDGCGRSVQSPAHVTSLTCACSIPPRFMRPLERPKTVTPDVTAFLSPPDPEDLIKEELPDEDPYVPYIPQLPPRPVRFPGRRKLTDDIEKFQPAEFGVGVESPAGSCDGLDIALETTVNKESPTPENASRRNNRPDRSDRPDGGDRSESRRERGGRGGRGGDRNSSTPVRERNMAADGVLPAAPDDTQAHPARPASKSEIEVQSDSDADGLAPDPSTAETDNGDPRRRHRRRGRRRGRGSGRASGGGES